MTNREKLLNEVVSKDIKDKLSNDIELLAKTLILETKTHNNLGCIYVVHEMGSVHIWFNYDKCVADVVVWLNKECKEKTKENQTKKQTKEKVYRWGKCNKCGEPLDMHYTTWCPNCTKPKELVKKHCVDVLMLLKWCDTRVEGLEKRVWECLFDTLEPNNDSILEFSFNDFYTDDIDGDYDEQLNDDLDFILENFDEDKLGIVYYKFSW